MVSFLKHPIEVVRKLIHITGSRLAADAPAATPVRTATVATAGAVILSTAAVVAVPALAPFVTTGGDYQPGRSDLDLIAVLDLPLHDIDGRTAGGATHESEQRSSARV